MKNLKSYLLAGAALIVLLVGGWCPARFGADARPRIARPAGRHS